MQGYIEIKRMHMNQLLFLGDFTTEERGVHAMKDGVAVDEKL